ncbi:unnamed protein product [Didymodactylos carnosus]|uniref:B30.2/SPRY domain-containing protein n=1 Tax=Didymodactylos carnosus TaxID=1234261 RepID=A0A8S2EMK4_9BILA|nr:unnamed protein product [Didymodactylos carnosus]CAF4030920.1 unnamed protein product [Didymodactylos carnosus]
MSFLTSQTPLCTTCGKATGAFKCHGCSQDFCSLHVAEHRQTLGKQMAKISSDYDHLQQSLNEYTKSRCHPLIQQIDQWEQNSIKKIQQSADDARQQVLNLLDLHIDEMGKTLESFTQQLAKARNNDNFVEADLEAWKMKLKKLESDLVAPETLRVEEDTDDFLPLITQIVISEVSNDIFEQSFGNIQIKDNGQVIEQGFLPPAGVIRTRNEYSVGCHQLRFKIENLSGSEKDKSWVFFGIVSNGASMQSKPYKAPTAYGWAGRNSVYCNGVKYIGLDGYTSDMEKGDTVVLLVDCNDRTIHFINKRTNSRHQLRIDVNTCPFPWRVNLCLYYASDCVRILPSSLYIHTAVMSKPMP